MRKHAFVSALLALSLTGCNTNIPDAPTLARGTTVSLSSAQLTVVKAGVGATLKDPRSAQYDNVRASKSPDGVTIVCGYVNARNSFGGYVGSRVFNGVLSSSGKFLLAGIADDPVSSSRVLTQCRQSGMNI